MKEILFYINNLNSGGAQRQIVELALGFKQRGYRVRFLVYHNDPSEFYHSYLIKNGIKIDGVFVQNYFKRILAVRKYLRSQKCDVLIVFLEVSSFMSELAAFPLKKWKLIVGERSADPAKKKSLRLRFFLFCHILADYVVANSYANINIVRKLAPIVPIKKYKVIYNTLDATKITPYEDFRFLSHDKVRLVVAASHRYLKNLNGLIEGVNLLTQEERSKLHIDWFGSNQFDKSLEEGLAKIHSYGLVETFFFHEATMDIYHYMKEADAIGLFSFFEGLPNAICEGLLLGKPVVVTKISDIPLFIKDGTNGFLCDADNAKSIAMALSNLLRSSADELKQMGQKNRELAIDLFDKDKILDEYESLF